MNEPRGGRAAGDGVFRCIMPVLIMLIVQILTQLFFGQVMFLYKGYNYTVGSFDEFTSEYIASLSSDNFTMVVTALSTIILSAVYLIWYRRELADSGAKITDKFKMKGVYNYKIIPGIILMSVGAAVIVTLVEEIVMLLRPELIDTSADILAMVGTSDYMVLNIVFLLYYVIISPICAELVFRGLTLGIARRRMTFMGANVIQALLFSIFAPNMVEILCLFLLGLDLGYICYKTDNVIITMVISILFYLTRLLLRGSATTDSSMIIMFVTIFTALAGAYLGVILIRDSVREKRG